MGGGREKESKKNGSEGKFGWGKAIRKKHQANRQGRSNRYRIGHTEKEKEKKMVGMVHRTSVVKRRGTMGGKTRSERNLVPALIGEVQGDGRTTEGQRTGKKSMCRGRQRSMVCHLSGKCRGAESTCRDCLMKTPYQKKAGERVKEGWTRVPSKKSPK